VVLPPSGAPPSGGPASLPDNVVEDEDAFDPLRVVAAELAEDPLAAGPLEPVATELSFPETDPCEPAPSDAPQPADATSTASEQIGYRAGGGATMARSHRRGVSKLKKVAQRCRPYARDALLDDYRAAGRPSRHFGGLKHRSTSPPPPSGRRAPLRLAARHSFGIALTLVAAIAGRNASAQTLSNGTFKAQIGTSGEISSLELTDDAFPTNYVLNATNAPGQNTSDHEWMGELMFTYRLGAGAWATALTNQSSDVRQITQGTDSVTVTYQGSSAAQGVKNFKLVETYSLVDDHLDWQIAVTNTTNQTLEFGDFGLPLPFNEYWSASSDVIYETRTVYHSFTGNSSSYVTAQRPSGVGPFLLLLPDASTDAGFEYMDNWVSKEHPGSAWAAGGGSPAWSNGLDVFYIHSNVIKSTNRGYLPNTSLVLAPNASKTYGFKFFAVQSHDDVKDHLYSQGLVDVTVVPGMMLSTNMTAKVDLHTSKTIGSVTAQYPSTTTISWLGTVATDHNLYEIAFGQLGQNDVTVDYGTGETTTLQFYVLEPIDVALQRHATFMVQSTQWATGDLKGIFDDWMMDTQSKRGATGGGGWGDDWGWTHGEFLAEKNAQSPVAAEVSALDTYLDAVWARAIDHTTYVVQDWWCPPGTSATQINGCYYDRAYAYPHAFNTYFSMYKIASRYPGLVSYHQSADTYLLHAYNIVHALYSGHGDPGTGYMGEQTLPDIGAALAAAGHTTEAQFVQNAIGQLYSAFSASPYPYGSEYNYDNTGEEAVYMAAAQQRDTSVLAKVNAKTRACRGQEPVWYYYADPVTLNGENWWQFQYTAALAGYCMDDFVRNQSTTPEADERLSYAAKIANLSAINSGQIDPNSANLGTVGWTYQAMKGNLYVNSFDPPTSMLHGNWRQMTGEADLGLFGALRILSADVSIDPLFGLTGYGCRVTSADGCYSITPTDGVFKRLNLITEKLHAELDRDRYAGATVSVGKDYLGFTLQNQLPGTAHTTNLTLAGFAPGTYAVSVGGTVSSSATVTAGGAAVVPLAVGAAATYAVQIGNGCSGSTTGPPVDAGPGLGSSDGGGAWGADGSSGGVRGGVGDAATNGGDGSGPSGDASSAGGSRREGFSSGCACGVAGGAGNEASRVGGVWLGLGLWIAATRRRKHRSSRCLH
jgi:hypothetical protein